MTVTTRDLHDCAPEPPKAVDVELPQSAVRAGDVFRNVTTTTADDIVSGDKVRIAELERQVEQLRAALDRRMDAARKTACARLPAWWSTRRRGR